MTERRKSLARIIESQGINYNNSDEKIIKEFQRIHKKRDSKGMKELFDVYFHWHYSVISKTCIDASKIVVYNSIKDYFDRLAYVADLDDISHDKMGCIQQFYRDSIGYGKFACKMMILGGEEIYIHFN